MRTCATLLGLLLLTLSFYECTCSGQMHRTLQMRLVDLLKSHETQTFERRLRDRDDLRGHRLFYSDEEFECCPSTTSRIQRTMAVNWEGVTVELFHTPNMTQTFYETMCLPGATNRQCKFIDPKYADRSRCVQQFSYAYAITRQWRKYDQQFSVEYIRIPTGCKCQIARSHTRKRKLRL